MVSDINSYSNWGLKRSTQDITNNIMSIITNANRFIIVGGYNFTFKTAGYTFFAELKLKAATIPTLLILPPNLYGSGNSAQSNIIDFCNNNGIGIILNSYNHSKWILTDKDLYYGSSNFSETSWKRKVEVVTIHNHSKINSPWAIKTIIDFKDFIKEEIVLIRNRSTMQRITGLIENTINIWNSIKVRIIKLNPSIEKVQITLNNYEDVILDLQETCILWYETSYFENFQEIQKLSSIILKKINTLCSFAYNNMFNEIINNGNSFKVDLNKEIVYTYNKYHSELLETIDICIKKLEFIDPLSKKGNNNNNIVVLDKMLEILKQ